MHCFDLLLRRKLQSTSTVQRKVCKKSFICRRKIQIKHRNWDFLSSSGSWHLLGFKFISTSLTSSGVSSCVLSQFCVICKRTFASPEFTWDILQCFSLVLIFSCSCSVTGSAWYFMSSSFHDCVMCKGAFAVGWDIPQMFCEVSALCVLSRARFWCKFL